MKEREIYVFNHLVSWYNIPDTRAERQRIAKLLAKYEESIPKGGCKCNAVQDMRPMNEISREVCARHQITIKQLKANSPLHEYSRMKRRARELVGARQEFAIAASLSGWSQQQIADYLGYKHHTCVLHLIKNRKPIRKRKEEENKLTLVRHKGKYSNTSPYGIATMLQK